MKFYIYTLGCKVNNYESRVMADLLINEGFIESEVDQNVDICIINTCSVTNMADHKSAKVIRSAVRKNPQAIIIVTGCFSQADKENAAQIDGVDIIIGNKNKTKLISYVNAYRKTKKQIVEVEDIMHTDFEPMMLNNFNRTRAFVKIQDGCNNFCSYCIIPYTRGNVRSKKREDVLEEITLLLSQGHKEIVLTGIHTGNYGAEFEDYDFADLLKDIVELDGLERLRISSIEMNEINDRVIRLIEKNKVLVDHMHIPLQSGSDAVLKAMNRKYNKEQFKEKIKELRKIRPEMSITTDVIVGFPGETEADIEEMIQFIQEISFTKLHVFPFSRRKGTAADTMENQVDEKTKKERSHRLLSLSRELEMKYMNPFIGKKITFIPEVCREGMLIGHAGNYLAIQAPGGEEDLDKEILVCLEKEEYPYLIGKRINEFSK